MKKAMVIVLDSFGIGASSDAAKFGDIGANTLLSIANACANGQCEQGRTGPLSLPNLQSLGLDLACQLSCDNLPNMATKAFHRRGAWGFARELSTAKDTTSGHWEMMGVPVLFDWGYFLKPTNSFPEELLNHFIAEAKLPGILGNCHASGTEIIKQLGEAHLSTGKPICYTSADSVFQIAFHESVWSRERAHRVCQIARKLCDEYNIARVIARPFVGSSSEDFSRTSNRRDFSMPAPSPTLLDQLLDNNINVVGVGKIADIFAHRGLSESKKASGLEALLHATNEAWQNAEQDTLVFTNLVDFDTNFGHRRDVCGYAKELESFDRKLGDLLDAIGRDDLLIISADHGCDPTFTGTDHTREHVPVLAFGSGLSGSIGRRETFADIGQSLAAFFELSPLNFGTSFLQYKSTKTESETGARDVNHSH